jgi:hypothetical protein
MRLLSMREVIVETVTGRMVAETVTLTEHVQVRRGVTVTVAVSSHVIIGMLLRAQKEDIAEVVRTGNSLQLLILVPIMREQAVDLMPAVATTMVAALHVRQTMIRMPSIVPRNVWRIRRLPLIPMHRYV